MTATAKATAGEAESPAAPPAAQDAPGMPLEPVVADGRWKDAATAKRAALAALEAHRLDEALAAASAATVLDSADGEAWLVLGAVFQDRGKMTDAIDSYRTCTVKGRVDPRGECRAMLRSLGKR